MLVSPQLLGETDTVERHGALLHAGMAALTIKNLAARQYADAKQKASDAEEISAEELGVDGGK